LSRWSVSAWRLSPLRDPPGFRPARAERGQARPGLQGLPRGGFQTSARGALGSDALGAGL